MAAWNLRYQHWQGQILLHLGGHKRNFRIPKLVHEAHPDGPWSRRVEASAGSVSLFTEALTHGIAPWEADYERRTLLYKYWVSNLNWGTKRVAVPKGYDLTARQQQLLGDPGDLHANFHRCFLRGWTKWLLNFDSPYFRGD